MAVSRMFLRGFALGGHRRSWPRSYFFGARAAECEEEEEEEEVGSCLSTAQKEELVKLCDRIVLLRHQDRKHVVPVMKEWEDAARGKSITKDSSHFVMRKLLQWKRPAHAMEVADWMYTSKAFPMDYKDAIFRMEVSIRTGLYRRAERIFNKLSFEEKTVDAYNTMLFMYSRKKMFGQAVFLFFNLRQSDLIPNNYTFNLLACLYRRCRAYKKMLGLVQRMEDAGVTPDLCFQNNLLTAKFMVEGLQSAEDHFQAILSSSAPELKPSHVATYSMMADVYMSAGMSDKAEACLWEIEQRMEKNQFVKLRKTYNILVSKYSRMNNFAAADRVWQKIQPKKCSDYISIIEAYGSAGRVVQAEKYFQEADRKGLVDTRRMFTPILNVYAAAGLGDKAEMVVSKMRELSLEPGSACYHYLVQAHLNSNDVGRALEVLDRAQIASRRDARCKLFPATLAAVLRALGDKQDAEQAEAVFRRWKVADLSFNTTSYNDLLVALLNSGKSVEADSFLRRMKKDNIKPNADTYRLLDQKCLIPPNLPST